MTKETHDDASRVPNATGVRILEFRDLYEKAAWLDSAASLDSLRKGVEDVAKRFLSVRDPEMRCREIQRHVRDGVRYVPDYRVTQGQRGEEFADSETIIKRGYDDCDGKSRLYVALVRAAEMLLALGTQAEIRPVFHAHPLEFVHVQAVTRWPGSRRYDYADPEGWCLTELILKGCEIGQDPDDCPRGPKGERLIA